MIQCDACNQWFHYVCIKTNTRVWENLDFALLVHESESSNIVCSINSFVTSYYISCRTSFPNLTRYS